MASSQAVTRGIRIEVRAVYVPERSAPEADEFFFAYTVRIANDGDEVVQLVSRHWIITDANGKQQEVRGAGVVGEQPWLRAGDVFEYTSACPLATPCGAMHGSYQMKAIGGAVFDATIAPFTLARPFELH